MSSLELSRQTIVEQVVAIQCSACWVGSYALRIHLNTALSIAIGGFRHGRPIDFAQGDYVYVGSAQGAPAGLALPRRLLRHATRSAGQAPHALRTVLLSHFSAAGLDVPSLLPTSPKRLRWNIDYLLDRAEASLTQVFYIRSPIRMEHALAAHLEGDPSTRVVAHGFGAHDHQGHTHLLAVPADGLWWDDWNRALLDITFASANRPLAGSQGAVRHAGANRNE